MQVEELYALLVENSGSIRHRGISALTKVLGLPDAKKFIEEVRNFGGGCLSVNTRQRLLPISLS